MIAPSVHPFCPLLWRIGEERFEKPIPSRGLNLCLHPGADWIVAVLQMLLREVPYGFTVIGPPKKHTFKYLSAVRIS